MPSFQTGPRPQPVMLPGGSGSYVATAMVQGKITGDDGGNVPVPPPTGPPSKEDGLQCSTKGGAETCTIT